MCVIYKKYSVLLRSSATGDPVRKFSTRVFAEPWIELHYEIVNLFKWQTQYNFQFLKATIQLKYYFSKIALELSWPELFLRFFAEFFFIFRYYQKSPFALSQLEDLKISALVKLPTENHIFHTLLKFRTWISLKFYWYIHILKKKITQITGLLGSRFFFFLFVIARKAKYVHF